MASHFFLSASAAGAPLAPASTSLSWAQSTGSTAQLAAAAGSADHSARPAGSVGSAPLSATRKCVRKAAPPASMSMRRA